MKQLVIKYFFIVPAAGIGARMRSDIPKQYLTIAGKTIIEYTLNTLLNYPALEKCVLVLHENDTYWASLKFTHPKLITTFGGKERSHSVFNGLVALKKECIHEYDWVLVHDAVRPFLHSTDIDKLITDIGEDALGGLLGSPVKNTLKQIEDNHCLETLDRQKLWQALTPQMFRYHWIFKGLQSAIEKQHIITDESNAIELLGKHPKIIEGRSDNIKITDSYDLALFKCVLGH